MASTSDLPVRENCFMFTAPDGDVSIDDLIDAVELVSGNDSVFVLQHMGGARFLVCTRNASQATRLMVAEGFRVNGENVPVEAVGPPVTYVNAYRYPAYLSDEVLSNALAQYGKVRGISFATVATRQNKLNGVRVIKIEMSKPVPNFATIAGHRVMFEYRGMRRVCARCGEVGHMATACSAPFCKRCGTFGHDTEGCTSECKRCGGHHGTRECFRRRSYASAARGFPSTSDHASDLAPLSGSLSPRSEKPQSRLQVLTPKITPGATVRKAGDHPTNIDPPTGSSEADSLASEREGRETSEEVTTASSETEPSPSDTASAQSSSASPRALPSDQDDCESLPSAQRAPASATERGSALPSVPLTPANVLAMVTSEDLEARAHDSALDELPVTGKGYYVLPEDSERNNTASTCPPPAQSKRLSRKSDAKAGQPHSGLEQRSRSRSRSRRRPGDDRRDGSERTASKDARQRRSGTVGQSSDSDAPPHAKSQKLEQKPVGANGSRRRSPEKAT
ncbi:uncharacterized protein LOC142765927 [Rhipicephalus microplus]|uniref:uncharacterized protein LOC142765927 n=1 Tax=Rhipicephalus microplus TaxID=6941 RepID=UPI003F6B5270